MSLGRRTRKAIGFGMKLVLFIGFVGCTSGHRAGKVPAMLASGRGAATGGDLSMGAAGYGARSPDVSVGNDTGTVTVDSGAMTGTCKLDSLRLDVSETGSGAAHPLRLAVVWGLLEYMEANADFDRSLRYQREDVSLRIAYDQPLTTTQGSIEVPLSAIALPYAENLLCFRACTNRAMCPCTQNPQVALGLVVAVEDSDMSGSVSLDEAKSAIRGYAGVVLGFSQRSYDYLAPVPPEAFYSGIFGMDRGVEAGVCPYSVIGGSERASTDSLWRVLDPSQRFGISVCLSQANDCGSRAPKI